MDRTGFGVAVNQWQHGILESGGTRTDTCDATDGNPPETRHIPDSVSRRIKNIEDWQKFSEIENVDNHHTASTEVMNR